MTALTLAQFPDEYNLNVQKRIMDRFNGRAATSTYPMYYDIEPTSQFQIIGDKYGSFGQMQGWADGADVPIDTAERIWTKTWQQSFYGLGFKVSRKMVQYGSRLNVVNMWADALADSAFELLNTKHVATLNNGFSGNISPDGVDLFDASHPTAGSTVSNLLAAASALSYAAVEATRLLAAQFVDYRGKSKPYNLDQLIHPPDIYSTAVNLAVNTAEPNTTDRNVNAFSGLSRVEEVKLSSATAWFMRDSMSRNLQSFVGQGFETSTYLHDPSKSLVHYAEMDFVQGVYDFEGIFASAGA